jgi:bisphosphoglycerate-dependent phosphoglycerate mutase
MYRWIQGQNKENKTSKDYGQDQVTVRQLRMREYIIALMNTDGYECMNHLGTAGI